MGTLKRWLAFGLTPEQEERFRQARLGADIAQAQPCIWLVLGPLLAFVVALFLPKDNAEGIRRFTLAVSVIIFAF